MENQIIGHILFDIYHHLPFIIFSEAGDFKK